MKYRCFKAECPICHQSGSIQLFINNKQQITYSRTRHSAINKESKKQQFIYCKINDLSELKTLLSKQNNILTTSTTLGQKGQTIRFETIDPKHGNCATKKQNKHWTGSSVRIEHQPQVLVKFFSFSSFILFLSLKRVTHYIPYIHLAFFSI